MRRPVAAWPVDSFFETDALSAGSGQVQLWSKHHYTAPIQGSEVWWPWYLVGPGRAWCSTAVSLGPARMAALAVDGCDVFVALTASDAGVREGVYRLSPGP